MCAGMMHCMDTTAHTIVDHLRTEGYFATYRVQDNGDDTTSIKWRFVGRMPSVEHFLNIVKRHAIANGCMVMRHSWTLETVLAIRKEDSDEC